MEYGLVSAAYISASVLFILSLGGLSNQEKAKRAVWFGIAGMAVSVVFTIFSGNSGNFWLLLPMIIVGSVIGYYVAKKVEMTEMPQLVAALHSFVGLAAVFIGINAQLELALIENFSGNLEELSGFSKKLASKNATEISIMAVEIFLGIFIGAVTFTGSVVAFGKLSGKIDGKVFKLPGGHGLNLAALICSLVIPNLLKSPMTLTKIKSITHIFMKNAQK